MRRLCPHCKHGASIDAATAQRYGLDRERMYFQARGCERCNGVGYHDRVGIFELIVIDDPLREAIAGGASSTAVAALARERGYRRMAEDCVEKLHAGVTSIEEFARARRRWRGGAFVSSGPGVSPNPPAPS